MRLVSSGSRRARSNIAAADRLPDRWSVQLNAVTWMLAMSRFSDAVSRALDLLQLKPDDPELLVLFGTAKARLRNPLMALVEIEAGLRAR